MSRTDKTNPFAVKLARSDLATVETHDHRNGICDLQHERSIEFGLDTCYLEFVYTGINTCCCRMCHGDWGRTPAERRRRNRARAKRATARWAAEYAETVNDPDMCVGMLPCLPGSEACCP